MPYIILSVAPPHHHPFSQKKGGGRGKKANAVRQFCKVSLSLSWSLNLSGEPDGFAPSWKMAVLSIYASPPPPPKNKKLAGKSTPTNFAKQ